MSDMVATGEASQRDSDLLRGVLDLCVLGVLDINPTHAYEVVERLRATGFDTIGYGTIYPLVTRLRRQGLLEQVSVASPIGPSSQYPRRHRERARGDVGLAHPMGGKHGSRSTGHGRT